MLGYTTKGILFMSKNILKKHTRGRGTIIDNELLANDALSWKAKGILCYLLSMGDGSTINQEGISRRAKDKVVSVKSGFKELETAGFISREISRDPDGKFNKTKVNLNCAKFEHVDLKG